MIRSNQFVAVALVLSALGFSACGGDDKAAEVPTTTPTAAPTPAPTPVPPAALGTGCKAGLGQRTNDCGRFSQTHQAALEAAIDKAIAEHPDVFDLNADKGAGAYRILSLGRYYQAVIGNLDAMGYCSHYNGEEIEIKKDNSLSDNYDIETGDQFIRRGSNSYTGTCRPASFPLAVEPSPAPYAGCPLGGSRPLACNKEYERYLNVVEEAIDEVARTNPEFFNLNQHAKGAAQNWWKVTNVNAYLAAVEQKIRARGLCTLYDGEEMHVKADNKLSDNYDILTGDEFVRRGAYMGTCHPADF